jgi:hypothetical protein
MPLGLHPVRLIFEVDVAGYRDREDFEVRLYPDIHLLSKASLTAPPAELNAPS